MRRVFRQWLSADNGAVAIMTALILPVMLLAMLGGLTVMKALAQRRELQSLAQAACNRALKPKRLVIFTDSERKARAEQFFDTLSAERLFDITTRQVVVGWLEAEVSASAIIHLVPGLGEQSDVTVHVREVCSGIPPYPALNDVVLSSNFKTPTGTNIGLTNKSSGGDWGIFTPQQIGWDGGDGSGIELQDWSKGFILSNGARSYLPVGVTNPYVVELDSDRLPGGPLGPLSTCGPAGMRDYNSSMYKNFELHPGTYRVSIWYRAREANNPNDTNKIAVYLEGTRPVTAKKLKLVWSDTGTTWRQRSFDIPVEQYGLFRLHVAAEGCGDSLGGLFNDLQIKYIKRPSPEFSDAVSTPATD